MVCTFWFKSNYINRFPIDEAKRNAQKSEIF